MVVLVMEASVNLLFLNLLLLQTRRLLVFPRGQSVPVVTMLHKLMLFNFVQFQNLHLPY